MLFSGDQVENPPANKSPKTPEKEMSELSIHPDNEQLGHVKHHQGSSGPGLAARHLGLTEDSERASMPDAMYEEAEKKLEEEMGGSSSGESNYDTAESGDDEERSCGMQTAASATQQNIPHSSFDPELAPYIPPIKNLSVVDNRTIVSQSHQTRLHLTQSEDSAKQGLDVTASGKGEETLLGAVNKTPVAPPRARKPPPQRTPKPAATLEEIKQLIVDKSLSKDEINTQIKLNSSYFSLPSIHFRKEDLSNVKSENISPEYDRRNNFDTGGAAAVINDSNEIEPAAPEEKTIDQENSAEVLRSDDENKKEDSVAHLSGRQKIDNNENQPADASLKTDSENVYENAETQKTDNKSADDPMDATDESEGQSGPPSVGAENPEPSHTQPGTLTSQMGFDKEKNPTGKSQANIFIFIITQRFSFFVYLSH